jgi:signal transduction histidine kinase
MLLAMALAVLELVGGAAAAPAPRLEAPAKNILLLYGESRVLPAVLELDEGIRFRFAEAGVHAQFFTEYLDLSWATDPRYHDHVRALLRAKYGARPLDAVIALGVLGLRFALENQAELLPGAPIVFAAVTPTSGVQIAGKSVTGVWMLPDAAATVAAARRLQPGARRLVVVGGVSPQDRVLLEDIRRDLVGHTTGLDTTYLEGLPLDDLRRTLAPLEPDSIVLLASLLRDAGGGTYSSRESLRLFAPMSGAHIYGLFDTLLGHGIVGGRLISVRSQGTEVADLTLRVLRGEPAASLAPIRGAANTLAFDARELRRWGLREADLPEGSVVVNRPSAFRLYRWQYLGAVALIVLQAALIVVLLAHRRRRKRAEAALTERLAFETLVSDLSAALINLRTVDVGVGLAHALKQVGEHLGVDRAAIAEISPSDGTVVLTYVWSAAGIPAPLPRLDVERFPWVADRMRRGQAYAFERLDDLPAEAATDRKGFAAIGIRSGICIPLQAGGTTIGALALTVLRKEQAWPTDLISRIEFVGGVFSTVLAKYRGEVELQTLRRDLTHVGRVASMGELAASIAHELNQPLTAILSNAQVARQLLDGGAEDVAELREIMADIIADDRRAGEVIRRLRDFVRKDEARRVRLDLNGVVQDVVSLVRNDALVRNVAVMTDLSPETPPVVADRIHLQQVVLNLVLNGLDAMRDAVERDLLVATGVDPSGTPYVAVGDRGGGIPDEDLRHVFEPFFTTKAEGLGMGLAIARSLVESHGGRLVAENNKQGGATFTFTIPAAGAETA